MSKFPDIIYITNNKRCGETQKKSHTTNYMNFKNKKY